jgi:hypothetical protein
MELLFRNIRSTEPPDKITADYLAQIGFRRQSDVKLLELLFFLGFIDNNLSPSELWKSAKGADEASFSAILAGALTRAYAKVFQKYPPGGLIDGKVLMTLFREETGVSDTEAAYMVLTLQVLSDIADFSSAVEKPAVKPAPAVPTTAEAHTEPAPTLPDVSDEPAPRIEIFREGLSLNITIPPEAMDKEMTDIVKVLLRKLM